MRVRCVVAALLAIGPPVCVRAALGPAYGGEALVAVRSLPASLQPARPADAVHRLVLGLVHETLVRVTADGRLEAGLARVWSRSADDREWVLELDPDARFHDDAAVSAVDALRSLRRFLEGRSPAATVLAERLVPDGLSAPDARHVVLRFREPQPEALEPLAAAAAAVTSPSGAGAGPFLPTHRVPGQRLALTAFTEHVRGRPYLDRLTLAVVADEGRRAADVASGRADAALDAGSSPAGAAGFSTLVLALDARRPPFDAPAARAAMAEAARAADVPAFVPGAVAIAAAPLSKGALARLGPLAMTVADDVPAAASQRLTAVLESLGVPLRIEPRSPEAARSANTPLRLLLEAPETPGGTAAIAEWRALSHGIEGAALPLAALPLRLATAGRLHGAHTGSDGVARVEDAWIAP